jgi:hypothetical protein
MRRLAAAVCLLLAAGCGGLPLSGGVHQPGAVPAEQRQGGDVQVLPPGPRDDAPSDEIVRGFFRSQGNPSNAHASAREFLAPERRAAWRDNGPVDVLGSVLDVQPLDGRSDLLRVTGGAIGQIAVDGSYAPVRHAIDFQVGLRKGARGRWQITTVPDGLVLSAADRDRSFRARNIYFLAPAAGPGSDPSHLVPDQVFLPVNANSADALVRRLLAGPSRPLGDSVATAFPSGTRVRSVRTNADGVVTADLSAEVGRATAAQKDQMSAQLVWTLRGLGTSFSQLRLLSAGKPVAGGSPGDSAFVRDASDWQTYDPDGLAPRAPLYYVTQRRLRVLDPTSGPPSAATSRQPVDVGAASPRGGSFAMVVRVRGGAQLRTGPAAGPFTLRAQATSLAFPSWGSGEQGLWFLQDGHVTLAPLTGRPATVPVDGIAGQGPVVALRVSRDGVRVALVTGTGRTSQLRVGRIAEREGRLRIVGVRSIAPGVDDIQDLSWDGATSLIVLGRAFTVTAPVRVAVDGSSIALVNRILPDQWAPLSLAAAPDRPLVVGAHLSGGPLALFLDRGSNPLVYEREPGVVGGQPFYPG